jgi:enterochelin esterase-like enzyme
LKNVVPLVESTYRVKPGPANRALAGLSMGGGQALRVLTTHPDQFAYVAIWSAGLFGGNAEEWEKRNEAFLNAADKVNSSVKLLSISIGENDFLRAASNALELALTKHGIKFESQGTISRHIFLHGQSLPQFLRRQLEKLPEAQGGKLQAEQAIGCLVLARAGSKAT